MALGFRRAKAVSSFVYMNSPTVLRTSTADIYDAYVMKNYARAPLTLVRGRGALVWDV